MKFGVIVFPGSNCEHDVYHMVGKVLRHPVEFIWHQSRNLTGFDAVVVPGGFSYGDYLRTGAIARFSPVMDSVREFAAAGGLVLGVCNGFQILLEAGLLPGAMLKNKGLKYVCQHVSIRVESSSTPFTSSLQTGQVLSIPIGHMEGNYFCDDCTLKELEANHQIVFRYCTGEGQTTEASNPNGSLSNIAGICNRSRNVLGMMPHPERASESILNSSDGLMIFESMAKCMVHS
jgi:phosphoribosylformylglycinamidine synthase subunit PurQ / glutaminase